MTKLEKLRMCNYALLVFTLLILASGIQLESTGSRGIVWVWLHIIVGVLFFSLAFWHIALNLMWGNWFEKFAKVKSHVTRFLWWMTLFTVIFGIAAMIHWLTSYTHSPLGGIHGKIGLVMTAVAIGHTIKRIKFFKRKKKP